MFDCIREIYSRISYKKWQHKGKPDPVPHFVKEMNVRAYGKDNNIDVFVETGTYLGDMVAAVRKDFGLIYSIELSREYFEKAKKKFERYDYIEIIQGDSAVVIPKIMKKIKESALFWFDAHYSSGNTARGEKETPIMEEIRTICESQINGHIILIDDARLFTGENDYPRVEALRDLIMKSYSESTFEVEDDIIRIHALR